MSKISESEKIFDAAIVGLGPAGATLARLLAERGLSVLAVDRKKSDPAAGGFQKPCGGLLAEDAQRSLSRQGLALPKSVLADPQLFSVRTIDLKTAREVYDKEQQAREQAYSLRRQAKNERRNRKGKAFSYSVGLLTDFGGFGS